MDLFDGDKAAIGMHVVCLDHLYDEVGEIIIEKHSSLIVDSIYITSENAFFGFDVNADGKAGPSNIKKHLGEFIQQAKDNNME